MLRSYTVLPDGDVLVSVDEGEFTISELPDELLTEEEVSVLNAAFPGALRSDYKPMAEASEYGMYNHEV